MKKLVSTILVILLLLTCTAFAFVGCTKDPLIGNSFQTEKTMNYFGSNKDCNASGFDFSKDTVTYYFIKLTGEKEIIHDSLSYTFNKKTGVITLDKINSTFGYYIQYKNDKIGYTFAMEIKDLENLKDFNFDYFLVK